MCAFKNSTKCDEIPFDPDSFLERLKILFQQTSCYLKALGHVTVNKPVISIIYIVVHTWPLCSAQILVDGVNPLESYFQKSTNISAIVQHMSVSFVSLQSSRVHLQSSTVILRNIVEDLCAMAYKKYCKIIISKEVCLHYVTLPL